MLSLSANGLLVLSRGDNAVLPLFLNAGTDLQPIRYKLQKIEKETYTLYDEVYLAIEEPNQPFECAIIKKKYNYKDLNKRGDVVIVLKHEDTRCLKPGKYYYEIRAKFLKEELNLPEDTYGTYYIYNPEINGLEEVLLTGNADPNQTYYSIIVNTVVPKREFWIE